MIYKTLPMLNVIYYHQLKIIMYDNPYDGMIALCLYTTQIIIITTNHYVNTNIIYSDVVHR